MDTYSAYNARKAVEVYKEEVVKLLNTHKIQSYFGLLLRILKAAHQGFNMIIVYPVDTTQYDEYYDNNPSTLGTTLPTQFTPDQLNILHALNSLVIR